MTIRCEATEEFGGKRMTGAQQQAQALHACPICAASASKPFETVLAAERRISFRLCKHCGVVFQSPRMSQSELEQFYREGYRGLYQASEEPTEKDLVMQEQRAERTLAMVHEHIQDVRHHLDIGSSSGALLQQFQDHYGCESAGIEPGDAYRSFSQNKGFSVFASLGELPERRQNFDLISMMHVLEHLPDPVATLIDLRKGLLKTGGYLLLEVPNLIEHEALEIAHLFAFTPRTLNQTVETAGFDVLWTRTHGSFRSPVLNLYITLLARSDEVADRGSPRHPASWTIPVFRRLGKLKRRLFTRLFPDWTWQAPESLWESQE